MTKTEDYGKGASMRTAACMIVFSIFLGLVVMFNADIEARPPAMPAFTQGQPRPSGMPPVLGEITNSAINEATVLLPAGYELRWIESGPNGSTVHAQNQASHSAVVIDWDWQTRTARRLFLHETRK